MQNTSLQNSAQRQSGITAIFIIIILSAIFVRLIGFLNMNVVFRDSVGFCINAGKLMGNPKQGIKAYTQEPIHPAIIGTIFKILFPDKPITQTYGLAKYWQQILFGDGILFTCLIIIAIFTLTKTFWSVSTGLWAAMLFAFHREAVILSINGMSELPYLTFFLSALYFIYISGISSKKSMNIGYGICSGLFIILSILTRKEGLSLILIAIIFFLFFLKNKRLSHKILSLISILISCCIGAGIFYAIGGRFYWLDAFFKYCVQWQNLTQQLRHSAIGSYSLLASVRPTSISQLLSLPISGLFQIGGYIPFILFLAYLPLRKRIKSIPNGTILILLALFVHLALAIFYVFATGLFVRRYLFVSSVLMLPFAAATIHYLTEQFSDKYEKNRIIAITAITITVIMAPQGIWRYIKSDYHKELINTTQWLNQNSPENAMLFVRDIRLGFYSNRNWITFRDDPKFVKTLPEKYLTKNTPCYIICPNKAKFDKWNELITIVLPEYKLIIRKEIPYKKNKKKMIIAVISHNT